MRQALANPFRISGECLMMASLVQSSALTVGIWVAALGVIGIFIRQIVPWRKVERDAEAVLRSDLMRRIENLEREQKLERASHEAERRALHHQLGNVNQCFDALLLLVEAAPEKASQHVKNIKEMRARQLLAEAEEKAIIRAAQITAFGAPAVREEEAA
jgi:hypothetical protein